VSRGWQRGLVDLEICIENAQDAVQLFVEHANVIVEQVHVLRYLEKIFVVICIWKAICG